MDFITIEALRRRITCFSKQKQYDSSVKGYALLLEGNSVTTQIQYPKDNKKGKVLIEDQLILQIYIPENTEWTIQLSIKDQTLCKRRLHFSTLHRNLNKDPLHVKLPITRLPRNIWMNLVISLADLVSGLWPGQTFRSVENITVTASCRLRRVFMLYNFRPSLGDLRHPYRQTVPRSYQFAPGVGYVDWVIDWSMFHDFVPSNSKVRKSIYGGSQQWIRKKVPKKIIANTKSSDSENLPVEVFPNSPFSSIAPDIPLLVDHPFSPMKQYSQNIPAIDSCQQKFASAGESSSSRPTSSNPSLGQLVESKTNTQNNLPYLAQKLPRSLAEERYSSTNTLSSNASGGDVVKSNFSTQDLISSRLQIPKSPFPIADDFSDYLPDKESSTRSRNSSSCSSARSGKRSDASSQCFDRIGYHDILETLVHMEEKKEPTKQLKRSTSNQGIAISAPLNFSPKSELMNEEIEILYDPCTNCFYDPLCKKFYKLLDVNNPRDEVDDKQKLVNVF